MAITLPTAVTPMGASPASTTFLLPYTEGQVEALLTIPMAAAAKGKKKGFRLTAGTSRDHEQVSSLYGELMSETCPLTQDSVQVIWGGPGGIAPIEWCLAHGVTDPLSHRQVRVYYWVHFGVAITSPTGSVHAGSIYYSLYGFWSLAQTSQFIEGIEITADTEAYTHIHSYTGPQATGPEQADAEGEDPTDESVQASDPPPVVEEPEISDAEEANEWEGWLSPEQAKALEDRAEEAENELTVLKVMLEKRAACLKISQDLINSQKEISASLKQQLDEKIKAMQEVSKKLIEKTRNESHALAQIETAKQQAKADAKAHYAPLVAQVRSLAITAGHISQQTGRPESTNRPPAADARPVPPPASADWKSMPKAPVTSKNLLSWKLWFEKQTAHTLDKGTLVSIINSPGFTSALNSVSLQSDASKCLACGDTLSDNPVAPNKNGKNCRSHLAKDGSPTGVAAGECAEGLNGTCEGCRPHGVINTKHSLSQCPLSYSTVKSVLLSIHFLQSLAKLDKPAKPESRKTGAPQTGGAQSGAPTSTKRRRTGESASVVSGMSSKPASSKTGAKGRGRGGKSVKGGGKGRAKKMPPSTDESN